MYTFKVYILSQIILSNQMENHPVSPTLSLTDNSIPNSKIQKADLAPDPESRLDSMEMKEKPMLDPTLAFRDLTDSTSKKESIHQLIAQLNVETNIRYQRTVDDTYCNVYAYDYCYFSKVYLPTVWWTTESIEKILKGQEVKAVFGTTVERIYSSAIHDWFLEWGASFGWKRMSTIDEIQQHVNANGGIGIICAKRKIKGLSGHIVPVVPETDLQKAYRKNDKVIYPLQSQAGKLNYNYFSEIRKDWWNDELYSSYVLYYHE